jgi:hypothetical protein
MELSTVELLLSALLALGATLAYLASLGLVGRAWRAIFTRLAGPLGFHGGVGVKVTRVASMYELSMPYFNAQAAAPGRTGWWVALVVTALVVGASFLLRNAYLPLGYALRFAAAIQTTALVFFAVAPASFPYDLPSYISGMMLIGAVLIGIVPLVLALTFYVIDVAWSRKVALTALIMAHLLVMVPLQYALQSAIIVHLSLIVLPLAFVLFGLLPEIMVLIALYGWGMSWPSPRARGSRQ